MLQAPSSFKSFERIRRAQRRGVPRDHKQQEAGAVVGYVVHSVATGRSAEACELDCHASVQCTQVLDPQAKTRRVAKVTMLGRRR